MKAAIVVLLCIPALVMLSGCAAQVVAQPPAGQVCCTLFSHAKLAELIEHVEAQACQGRL